MTNKSASLPLYKLVPSMATVIGMLFGLFALKYAVAGVFEKSVILLIIAGIIDGIDGKLARILDASSKFGAQLDSLADFLNFGVVPALTVYFWKTHEVKALGWSVALFFIICQSIRLARFNAKLDLEPEIPELKNKFFEGIAAPMGGALSLLPIMISFLIAEKFDNISFEINSYMVLIYVIFIAIMGVSRVPTFSLKALKIPNRAVYMILAFVAILVIFAISEPWITFPVLGLLYFISIPWCAYRYHILKNKYRSK